MTAAARRGRALDIPGVRCRRDDNGVLHRDMDHWPDTITVTVGETNAVCNHTAGDPVHITDDGLLIIRTVEGSAGYAFVKGTLWRRTI